MLKVVIDSNVFVSILYGGILKKKFLKSIFKKKILIIYSPDLINELHWVLSRKEFGFSKPDIQKILIILYKFGKCVFPEENIKVCRDVEDNKVLECAVAGKVDFIITGDKYLLSLNPFKNIQIITPSEFLKKLK